MHFSLASLALCLATLEFAHAGTQLFQLDCTDTPMSCNNDCYAMYIAGKTSTLNWKNDGIDRRKDSGCTQTKNGKSICGSSGDAHYSQSGNSCDEYPYNSVIEGGTGAILRCVPLKDNTKEGNQLSSLLNRKTDGCGGKPCTFKMMMKSNTLSNSPYCKNKKGKNDGFQFEKKNGVYLNAKMKREGNSSEGFEYALHEPNEADFIEPEHRREFLLSNGDKAILLSNDMEENWDNSTVTTANGTATIVKELFGMDKTEHFRPLTNLTAYHFRS